MIRPPYSALKINTLSKPSSPRPLPSEDLDMLEAANKEKEYVSWRGASPAPLCQPQEEFLLTSIKYAEYRDIKR
jgi:hypothetical protein